MLTEKIEFLEDLWPEIYSSRQNKNILTWPCTGIEEFNKTPCLVVSKERLKGLIPLEESGINVSHDDKISRRRLMSLIGQDINFLVIGIDKKNNLFVGSRLKAMEKLSQIAWDKLEPGQIKTVIARRIIRRPKQDGTVNDIGLYVELDGIEIFLPVQELSYGWVGDISSQIQPGDVFDVKVVNIDKDKQRIDLSVKSLYPDPWPDCADRYNKNAIYAGTVTGIAQYGIFVDFEPGVNALCRHPKSGKLTKGDKVAVLITRINSNEKKINGVITRVLRRN